MFVAGRGCPAGWVFPARPSRGRCQPWEVASWERWVALAEPWVHPCRGAGLGHGAVGMTRPRGLQGNGEGNAKSDPERSMEAPGLLGQKKCVC